MPDVVVRIVVLVALAAGVVAVVGCGGEPRPSTSTPAAAQAPDAAVPSTPKALSGRLSAADVAVRRAIDDWRGGGAAHGAPPGPVAAGALYVRRAVHRLADRPALAAATIRRLPSRLARETRGLTTALRDLHKLSAGWPAHRVRTGPPAPLGELLRSYRAAQQRFGVRWQYLAAINLVESAFGRVRNHSVAGAQGPMQFMPSTWHAYGLGGDIRDPGDAILGAANLLRQSGAPGDYAQALYAYNPSSLYVDAVRRYAGVIGRDPDALYLLYSWPSP